MSQRILLTLDGSVLDDAAFSEARRIAAGGAEIHLLHVVPAPSVPVGTPLPRMTDMTPSAPVAVGLAGADAPVTAPFPSSALREAFPEGDSPLLDQAVQYLERRRRQLHGTPGQDLVRTGAPADAILEVASLFNINLVVMSTRARTGIARWFLGSVSHDVLRRSRLPVVLVRKGIPVRPERLRRMLVPISGAPEAQAILSVVQPLAVRLGAEIILLEVVGKGRRSSSGDLGDIARDLGQVVTLEGDPTEEILKHAKSRNADLIAMAAPLRKRSRLLGISVPEAVLARADRPVLLQNPVLQGSRKVRRA